MGCLVSASVTDLPTILKFITEQVSPKNAVEVTLSLSLLYITL